jgi:hypothetical protein
MSKTARLFDRPSVGSASHGSAGQPSSTVIALPPASSVPGPAMQPDSVTATSSNVFRTSAQASRRRLKFVVGR